MPILALLLGFLPVTVAQQPICGIQLMGRRQLNMDDIRIFTNQQFGQLTILIVDGEPWFSASDSVSILGFSEADNALESYVYPENRKGWIYVDSSEYLIPMDTVNTLGLCNLIGYSKLPNIQNFCRWISYMVLPACSRPRSPDDESYGFETSDKECGCNQVNPEQSRIILQNGISAQHKDGLPGIDIPLCDTCIALNNRTVRWRTKRKEIKR